MMDFINRIRDINIPLVLSALFIFNLAGEASAQNASASPDMNEPMTNVIERGLTRCREQALTLAETVGKEEGKFPQTYDNGRLRTTHYKNWVCGFFPGMLWMLNGDRQDEKMEEYARLFTERVIPCKDIKTTHDLGFMLYCCMAPAYRQTGDRRYLEAMMTGADNLALRFDKRVGVIKSWNAKKHWRYPVIIDNMMNLELLCFAARQSGSKRLLNIATTHARTTMKNHFRDDYSSFHVVEYDTVSGGYKERATYQGYADNSSWSRGQAWALYGFTMMYRETGRHEYLDQARKVAAYLCSRKDWPADMIPYWDFDAAPLSSAKGAKRILSDSKDRESSVPRDASAAACMASAFIELSMYDKENGERWLKMAEHQLRSLSTPTYLAERGENGGFVLKHGVGNLNKNSEVDVPLTYGDYYYTEALLRYKSMLEGRKYIAGEAAQDDRQYWIDQLTKIASPVIDNLSEGSLHKNMPFESKEQNRRGVSYLEAAGRTILGLSGWLSLGADKSAEGMLRDEWLQKTRRAIANMVDPKSPDYMLFDYLHIGDKRYNQALVDAAFFAQGLLRAKSQLYDALDKKTQQNIINELKRSRNIKPNESNWLLFASIIEAFMLETTGDCDKQRLTYGVKRFMEDGWYKGDGIYGDGNDYRADYYNSFVINTMLTDVVDVMAKHGLVADDVLDRQRKRQQRYAAIQERQIMPDGAFPVCGRSMAYRFACFSQLAQTALQHRLPAPLTPAQVRCAMTAMVKRIQQNDNFDKDGWLVAGFSGHQPSIAEKYINTGSLYLCTAAFSALGLPADDEFWVVPQTPWTAVKAYGGTDIPCDHALRDSKWKKK